MIRNMVMVSLSGKFDHGNDLLGMMAKFIKGIGTMEFSMEMGLLLMSRVKREKEFGKMGSM